jgi:Ca2+-binding RTX toxin-like protein
MRGTSGDDDLFGNRRDNDIFGLGGWDDIRGRAGDDLLVGGSGSDLIFGGSGRDALFGGRGRDLLYGGTGADDFWFDTRHSYDIIEDFRRNDALVIDAGDGTFEDVRRRDIDIDHRPDYDRISVDGDVVARVYGANVGYDDIFIVT